MESCLCLTYVWHEVNCSLQRQDGDIETIRLRCELEIRMDIDATDAKGVGGQRFHGRVDHIIAKRDVHLTGRGTCHTMPGSHHMTTRDQRTATSATSIEIVGQNVKEKLVVATHLEEPMRMYACQGKEPKPASSPPTMRRCAVCLASEMPQPVWRVDGIRDHEMTRREKERKRKTEGIV